MSHGHCSCPECGTILRIRDRSFVGREIQCPDCQTQLEIKLTEEREYVATVPQAKPKPKKEKILPAAIVVNQTRSVFQQRLGSLARSPLFMAWALAAGVMLFVAAVILRPAVRFQTSRSTTTKETESSRTTSRDPQGDANSEEQINAPDHEQTTVAGDPGSNAPPEPPVVRPAPDMAPKPSEKPAESPIDATVASEPAKPPVVRPPVAPADLKPPVDVEQQLRFTLQGYVSKGPVRRETLIRELEEALGGPKILYNRDELGEKLLEGSISVSLTNNPTLGDILKVVADSAGWEYEVDKEKLAVRLRPKKVAGQ